MSIAQQNTIKSPKTSGEVASLLDHTILHPTITDREVASSLSSVLHLPLASVCIKPSHVTIAKEMLAGTKIAVCTVVGFPHGTSVPAIKAAEARRAFDDGATEIDMVVNTGRVLSDAWEDVYDDITAVLDVVSSANGLLKVIFETDFLTADEPKVRLCEICNDLRVDFVKTSTGFGFVKGTGGDFSYVGATDHDLALMFQNCSSGVGVKASGGIRTLDRALQCIELGATRLGVTATLAIIDEARERIGV